MKFFNTKEEVIDIELTQVGKRKLAKGRFKPKFYAFFDEDVLYDTSYAGYTEIQQGAADRIKNDTPRLKTQYVRSGIETTFLRLTDQMKHGVEANNEAMDMNTPFLPLGNSSGNEFPPAWNIFFAEGEITKPVVNYSASYGAQPIPQIYSSIEIKTQVEFDESMAVYDEQTEQEVLSGPKRPGRPLVTTEMEAKGHTAATIPQQQFYTDGSFLKTTQTGVILDVAEANSDFVKENFDLEVFEIIEGDHGEILRPLYVGDPGGDGMMYDTEAELSELTIDLTRHYAGHYIDIFVDGELDAAAMAKVDGTQLSKANSQTGKNFALEDAEGYPASGATSPYGSGDAFGNTDLDSQKEPC